MFEFLKNILSKKNIEEKIQRIERKSFDNFMFSGFGNEDVEVGFSEAYEFYDSAAPLAMVIDKISTTAASVYPVLSDGENIITDHPALELLNNPGYNRTYEELMRDYYVSRLLTNNGFLNLVGPVSSIPIAVEYIHPTFVTVKASEDDGYADIYEVNRSTSFGSSATVFKREVKNKKWRYLSGNLREIIHYKGVSDNNGLIGRSPLTAIRLEIEQRIEGATHNAALLRNGARPSLHVNFEEALTEEQHSRVVASLRNKFQGSKNAGDVIVTDGSKINFHSFITTPRDLDYLNLMNMTRDIIAQRYNVPLPLISGEQMTYSNVQTSELSFWNDTILPLIETTMSFFTRGILSRFGAQNLFFTVDRSAISALELRNFETAKNMQSIGVFSDNEVRLKAGYEGIQGGDKIYKPSNMVPVGADKTEDLIPTKSIYNTYIETCKNLGIEEKDAREFWDAQ